MKRRASEPGEFRYACESEESRREQEKWPRPPLPSDFSAATHSITFQQMEIKYVLERGGGFTRPGVNDIDEEDDEDEDERPVVKMFGCTQEGYSIALSVHNFMPYIYVPVPHSISLLTASEKDVCLALYKALGTRMKAKTGSGDDIVYQVTVEQKMSIMHYREEKSAFFKITFTSPKYIAQARAVLEDEGLKLVACGGIGGTNGNDIVIDSFPTFESNIVYTLRFMVDQGIGGASWVHLPAGKYRLITGRGGGGERKCASTIEAEVHYEDLVAYAVDDEAWSHIAPLRILSFDIECAGRPGIFPEPSVDPVIQIANYVTVHGQEKPVLANVFVLDTCSPISGVDVRCFRSEQELLKAWSRFVVAVDPDLLTGYNIVNFDLGYLKDRASALKLRDFDQFTRVRAKRIVAKDAKFSSAQTGSRESKEWSIDGRVVFDMYQVIQRDKKLSSYTLNNVSAHFLNQQKEDVHHSQITKLHQGTADDRHRLAVYCCKDALLPLRLCDALVCLVGYVEMARVTGVPFTFLLTRGQGIKVVSQILRKARGMDLLMPTVKPRGGDEGFDGAKVFDAKAGFYDKPILTLDFASLYPSIMQAHNLCYTTLLPPGFNKEGNNINYATPLVEGVDYAVSPMGDCFILDTKKKGILPSILESLLKARGRAKVLMAAATDKMQEQVYNCRQLALKVSANSVYGFTGQSVGSLPCLQISSSVTSYGRQMIIKTAEVMKEHYSIKNGYAHDADVIYGDTDSVMVWTGVSTVAEAIAIGKEAAQMVSAHFIKPIKLEFEKVYYPWLLMSKKKYAGLFWTKPDKWDKIDSKGIESVRRDNCGIVRYVVDIVLQRILVKQDVVGAIEFSKGIISDILQNKVDLSLLIITKAYSRDAEAYKSPQAHIKLAQKMAKRDPATAPAVGDRIPYVIVRGDKKSKMSEKAEDPLYVLQNDIPVDAQYYIEQLISPLCRLFAPMIDNPKGILTTGEHTRHLVMPRSKTGGGGGAVKGSLAAFVVVRENCAGCQAPLEQGQKTLCSHCRSQPDQVIDIYNKYLNSTREKEMQFSRLWTHCQNCTGNLHLEVICSANDCPIFYKRTKVYKELGESQKALARFDLLEW